MKLNSKDLGKATITRSDNGINIEAKEETINTIIEILEISFRRKIPKSEKA